MQADQSGDLIPEKIHIINTKIVKYNIDTPFDFQLENVKGHKYDVGFALSFNINDSLIKADFELEVSTNNDDEKAPKAIGNFHFVFIFHVENLSDLAITNENNKEINLSNGLGNALASITYSTSRGILLTHLKGTGLENFTLPVINPNELLKSNAGN